jgi:hypothetical protein
MTVTNPSSEGSQEGKRIQVSSMHGACQPTRLARCRHHRLSAVDINKR